MTPRKTGAILADWLASRPNGALPTLKEAQEALIDEALRRNNGNQSIAADLLGLTREALNKRLMRQRRGKKASATSLHNTVNYRRNGGKPEE